MLACKQINMRNVDLHLCFILRPEYAAVVFIVFFPLKRTTNENSRAAAN